MRKWVSYAYYQSFQLCNVSFTLICIKHCNADSGKVPAFCLPLPGPGAFLGWDGVAVLDRDQALLHLPNFRAQAGAGGAQADPQLLTGRVRAGAGGASRAVTAVAST